MPPIRRSVVFLASVVVAFVAPLAIGATDVPRLPELARLKIAAESGNAQAEYEYGKKIALSNPAESFAMLLRAAQQGHGLAETVVGKRYLRDATFNTKERAKLQRMGVRYISCAAFKGDPEAQAELSTCYDRGILFTKDPVLAYGWLAVALKISGGPVSGNIHKHNLDVLIAKTSSPDVAKGEKFADQFRVGMRNFVEAEVLVTQLKLSAFYTLNGKKLVVVNQTKIAEGETKSLVVDDEPLELTCVRIVGRTANFKSGVHEFQLTAP